MPATYLAIYGTMIYTAPAVRNAFDAGKSITRPSGRGLDPRYLYFFGPFERASSRQANAFWGPKKLRFSGPNPLPLAQVMDLPTSKALHTGPYQSEVHRQFYVHELPRVTLTGYEAVS